MAVSTAAIDHRFYLCQGFSRQHPLVHVAADADANQSPLNSYQPLGDCIYDMPRQHFPKYEHHHGFAAQRDQSMLQVRCSKHIARHREQRLPGAITALHVDMGYGQIYLSE